MRTRVLDRRRNDGRGGHEEQPVGLRPRVGNRRVELQNSDCTTVGDQRHTEIRANATADRATFLLRLVRAEETAALNDQAAIFGGYQKLVRYYPKTEHWSKVLESLLRVEKNDLAVLYVLRLMADTGVLTIKEYYLEYSQRAVEQALPGEALKVLETGFEKKILEGEQSQRALADVRKKAQTDKAQLPEIEKEVRASKATTGNP